ncbi:sodium-coupled monocarboxylate transporter 1 [Eupeodes corollae]|uniref:sodium-coupled monocarboxylate transporter 1 n=1 Tax=Eupeodes corollae TaxID=290404 RepID=UPI002490764C|nr:sodium-coupled monocarboxylate transporter 1 [Eupeodes corollae]XP_055907809.1 sodium-coupled monocarboxylate transporter 1 [Eupeodes corollae]XP_055907810.1 sodium-coupled monocarboxylate transporter 1 [Eupeodes corollae]XP_055907811.1 sodium-coupled monocarboxylate transporter 1 [Eupeodes corollae]XP_055907812.1 sodium-coupled monocarboxylate transporter 1 [Eupeodes corollae]
MMDSIDTTVYSIASTTFELQMSSTTSNPFLAATSARTSSSLNSETTSSSIVSTSSQLSNTITEALLTVLPSTTEKVLSVGDLSSSLQHFGWMDYFVFMMMLVVCAVIGFYFGFVEKKGREQRRGSVALDYLVGGRKMKVFPVSLSLIASFVSGISLLGTSTEIYVYGTQYAFMLFTIGFAGIISWYIFLPVFINLQLTSTYEYFEMRFDKRIRFFGSTLFTIGTIVWLPIVIYVPALAFNQVTGINIHIITPIVCVVCIFYTMVGGLKAVIWTDVIQTFIMLGSIILVIIKGTIDVGGIGVVWQRNFDSGRIEIPELTLDHTKRFSMFSVFIGGSLYWTQVTAGNQVIVQRFLSVPSLKEAKHALICFSIGTFLLLGCCAYNGLLIFATYHDCDPLSTKLAKAKDQLVPLLVMDILKFIPGLSGLFVSGVFSAALSSLSTGLNSLSAVFLEDFVKPNVKIPLTERQTAVIMRLVVLLLGVLCVALVFVVEKLGMVLQLSMTLSSITNGPLFGLFIMGLCLPYVNTKSALTGSIIAFIVMTWICINGQLASINGELVFPTKPVSTEGCTYFFETIPFLNSTLASPAMAPTLFQSIYHMSFIWYVTVGMIITVIFGNIATLFVGTTEPSNIDLNLYSPFISRLLKPEKYTSVSKGENETVILAFDVNEKLPN